MRNYTKATIEFRPQVHAEMSQWVLERAGDEAVALKLLDASIFEAFRAAKAANDLGICQRC